MNPAAALLALPLALLAPDAVATDFDSRMVAAKNAIATRDGYAYDLALVPAVHAAMLRCVPPGRAKVDRAQSFTTVASVDATGRVSDVRVRPSAPLAQCFARRLGAMKLQPPPTGAKGAGHPILIQIRDRF